VTAFLDPRSLPEPPEGEEADDGEQTTAEGVVHDGLGIPRVAYRCWTERLTAPLDGDFLIFHRAAVWDARGRTVESGPAATRAAALNEALGRYLATAGSPAGPFAWATLEAAGTGGTFRG
jgi:hypothetical protein